MAGTLSDTPSFRDEPIDAACMVCGTATVVDYSDGVLTQRCPDCEGAVRDPDEPSGLIAREYRPPVGLRNRSPREFVGHGKAWNRHRRHAFVEGTCPDCSGTVTTRVDVCHDHGSDDWTPCEDCGRIHEIEAIYVCDVCNSSLKTGVWNTILTDVAVIAFFHDHGLDTRALENELAYGVLFDAVETVTVESTRPLRVLVTVELDGDKLHVTLDDETRVVEAVEDARPRPESNPDA